MGKQRTLNTQEDESLNIANLKAIAEDIKSKSDKYDSADVNTGIDTTEYTDYMDNVDSSFGMGVLNEQRATNQSSSDKIRNGITRGLVTGAGSVVESTLGVVDGVLEATTTQDLSKLSDNVVGRTVDEVNKWASENIPSYYTQATEENNFALNAIGAGGGEGLINFWADKFANGAGYFAGAYVTGLGLSKLFQISKASQALLNVTGKTDDIAAITQAAKTSAKLVDGAKSLAVAGFMAHGESAGIGRSTKDSIKLQLETDRKEGLNTLDDEAIEKIANSGANTAYGISLLTTAGTDLLQFGKMINPSYKAGKKELNSIIKGADGLLESGTVGSKAFDRIKRLGVGTLEEGGQEGSQFATEKGTVDYYGNRYSNYGENADVFNSMITGMSETFGTAEGLESMFLGALLGGPTSVAQGKGEYDERIANTDRVVGLINNFDTVINKKESAARGAYYIDKMQKSLEKGDLFDYKNNEYQQLKSYVQEVVDNGAYEYLNDRLDSAKDLNDDDFKQLYGFDLKEELPKSKQEIVNDAKKSVAKLKESYDEINLKFPNLAKPVKDTLYDAVTNFDNIDTREKELSTKVMELTGSATLVELSNKINYDQGDFETYSDNNSYEIKGEKVSFEEYKKSKKEEYRNEYNTKVKEVLNNSKNPAKSIETLEVLNDLNKLAQRREDYIAKYNEAVSIQGQATIIKEAARIEKKVRDSYKKNEAKKEEKELADIVKQQTEAAIVETKTKVDAIKDNLNSKINALPIKEKAEGNLNSKNLEIKKEDILTELEEINKKLEAANSLETIQLEDRKLSLENNLQSLNETTVEDLETVEFNEAVKAGETPYAGLSLAERTLDERQLESKLDVQTDNNGQKVVDRFKIVPAAHSIARLDRKYNYDEKTDKYTDADNELSSDLDNKNLLSHNDYQVGTEFILEVDKSFSIQSKEGEITYETLRQREVEEGKDGLLIPIAIKNSEGTIIGYLHDIDWMNDKNVADTKDGGNIQLQQDKLAVLRRDVLANESLSVKVTNKSIGNLAKSFDNTQASLTDRFPDNSLRFAIVKKGRLHQGESEDLTLGEEEELIEYEKYINGALYAILPTPVKGQNLPVLININKANKFTTTIINAIDAHITGNLNIIKQVEDHTGINIKTKAGLNDFISKFILVRPFDKKTDVAATNNENIKFFNINSKGIWFASGGGLLRGIKTIEDLQKNIVNLTNHLDNSYVSMSLKQLENNDKLFEYSLIDSDGSVQNISHKNYNEFIKENTSTNLISFKLPNGDYSYFQQSVITFEDTNKPNTIQNIQLASPLEVEQAEETIEDRKADIERRRKTELYKAEDEYVATNRIKEEEFAKKHNRLLMLANPKKYGTLYEEFSKPFENKYDTTILEINNRYNAELTALNNNINTPTKPIKTESGDGDIVIIVPENDDEDYSLNTNDAGVNFTLKSIKILKSDKAIQIFEKGKKANWDLNKILSELQIPKEQKQLILDIVSNTRIETKEGMSPWDDNANYVKEWTREEIALQLAANYSYSIEINTAKSNIKTIDYVGEDFPMGAGFVDEIKTEELNNTNYYSNLTVPGGTNYTENEIATPLITPSIKGHAKFATYKGIGWFRSDEAKKENIKTRRILEVQSDLFQKGRDKTDLITNLKWEYDDEHEGIHYVNLIDTNSNIVGQETFKNIESVKSFIKDKNNNSEGKISKQNQFLQLLNKDNNWVTFFVKSVIQDSAKKDYEKVLFPSGNTASKVEGHETIEDFKKQKEDRIEQLEQQKIKGLEYGFGRDEEGEYLDDDVAIERLDNEINVIKKELVDVEKNGVGSLKPIYTFYEKTVANILKKLGNVNSITDEFGNTWNEVTLDANSYNDIDLSLASNNDLSDNDIAAIKDAYKEVLIDGFNSTQQNSIVNFLAAQISSTVTKGDSIEEVFKKWYNVLDKNKGNKAIDKILNNWNTFKKFTIQKISKIKNIQIDKNIEDTAFEDVDDVLDTSNWNDESSLMTDPKKKISAKLREFFAFLPKVQSVDRLGKLTYSKNYIGLVEYQNADEVMNSVLGILSNTDCNYATMMAKLVDYSKNNPSLLSVINKLNNASQEVKNQFTTFASKHYTTMQMVKSKRSNNGSNYLSILNVNQNEESKIIISNWQNNLRISNVVQTNEQGIEVINEENKKVLLDEFTELSNNITKDGLNNWLSKLGVTLSDNSLNDIISDSKGVFGLSLADLFKDKSGVFKLMADRLKNEKAVAEENEEEETEQESSISINSPLVNNSGIRKLALLESKYTTKYFTTSYKNGENNTISAYSNNKYFTNKFREITNNTNGIVDKLLKLSFNGTSSWLKNHTKRIRYNYIDTIKVDDNKIGTKLKDQSEREHEMTKTGLFFNSAKEVKDRMAHFLYPTMSDKTTMLSITAPAFDTVIASDGRLSRDTIDALVDVVRGEYNRILNFQELEKKGTAPIIDGYSQGAKKFLLFPELNDSQLFADGELLPYEGTNITFIKEYLQDTIKDLVDQKVDKWLDLGLVTNTNNELASKYLDANYMYNIAAQRKNDENGAVRYAATDFVVNNIISNANIFQMFIGDPALFTKLKGGKVDIAETLVNIGKRLAKEIAPGIDIPNSNNNKYKQILLKDRISSSTRIDYLKKLFGENSEQAKAYSKIESTDAQEYTTLAEHIYVMKQLGTISEKDYFLIKRKAKKGQTLDFRELGIVLQPIKPVYVESIIDTESDVARQVYIKSSSFPLIRQVTKGLEINKLRKAMEKHGVSRVAYKTAVKVGGSNYVDIFNSNGTIKDDLDLANGLILPRTGFKIQQEVPFDEDKDSIVKGSQETKLLFGDIMDLSGMKELKSEYDSIHEKMYKESYDTLMSEYTNEYGEVDKVKIQKLLIDEAKSRNFSINEIQSLLLNEKGEFNLPLWSSVSANKIESLLISIVDNKIRKKKMNGFSSVLASEEGFIGQSLVSNVYWINGHDNTRSLKGMENGNPAEVIVPFKFRNADGNLIELNDLLDETGRIDISKLPDELLQMFGYRIPTQGHNSMSYMKVVGFFPYEMGDLIVTPKDFTVQMGSDFDVDKLYVYQYETRFVLDEKINGGKLIRKEDSDSNRLLDIHIKVLQHEGVQKRINEPLGFGMLKDLAKGIEVADVTTPLSDEYQKLKFINGTAGKAGVGTFSLDSTFNSIIQGTNIKLSDDVVVNLPTINNTKPNKLTNIMSSFGRLKSEIISAFQSASVDNEKEQILDKLNINNETFDAIRSLIQLGYEEDIIVSIINSPVVKKYVEKVRKLKDSTVEYNANVEESVISELTSDYLSSIKPDELEETLNYKNLDTNNLTDSLEDNYRILDVFEKHRIIGKEIKLIQSAINTDSKGLGKSLFDTMYKENQVRKLFNSTIIENTSELIGVIDKESKQIKPTTIAGFASVYALFTNNILWKKFFPYNSYAVSEIYKDIERSSNELKATDYRTIWDNIKSYIYTKSEIGLYSNDIDTERRNLLYDIKDENGNLIIKSFAREWEEFKNTKQGRINAFVARTNTKIFPNGEKESIVIYNASASEGLNEDEIHQAFADLIINERTRPLAERAVKYFFLKGGLQKANEFGKYIPTAYLTRKNGFSQFLDTFSFNDTFNFEGFVKQYFQNNPYKASKFNDAIIEKNDDNYIKIYDDSYQGKKYLNKDYKLYEYVGNNIYLQIPILKSEYNANINESIDNTTELDSTDNKFLNNPFSSYNSLTTYNLEDGKNLSKDTFEVIAKSPNKLHRAVANALLNNFSKLSKYTFKTTDINVKGRFNGVDLMINSKNNVSSDILEGTILHESIHGLTSDLINAYNREEFGKLTESQKDTIRRLDRQRLALLDNINKNPAAKAKFDKFLELRERQKKGDNVPIGTQSISENYGATNTKEFVTMALTDSTFQKLLNDIAYNEEGSFLDKFIDLITELLDSLGFDIKKGSLLESAVRDSILLINDSKNRYDIEVVVDESPSNNKEVDRELNRLKKKYYQFGKFTPFRYNELMSELATINNRLIREFGEYIKLERDTVNNLKFQILSTDSSLVGEESKYKKLIDVKKSLLLEIKKEILNTTSKRKAGKLDDKKKQLTEEIEILEQESNIQDIIRIGKNDLLEVNRILAQESVSPNDIQYANKLLTILERYIEYSFNDGDLEVDEDGDYSENVNQIKNLIGNTSISRTKLDKLSLSTALQQVNMITNGNYTMGDLIVNGEISGLSANLLDISRNNSVLSSAIDILLRKANFNTENEAGKIFDKVDTLLDKLKNNNLFKKEGFKLFLNKTGNFKTPYSDKFFEQSKDILKNAKSSNTKESWEKYSNWKRKNEILFDVRKLFNADYIERGGNAYSEDDKNNHILELKSVIGEKRFNELHTRLKDKIENYKEDYELAVERYTEQEPDDFADRERLINQWEIENSPFKYVESILDNKQFKMGNEFITPKGYDSTYEVPRKVDTDGNTTEWYDEEYETIEKDDDLYNFYRYAIDTIHDMYKLLPKSKIDKLKYNYLPEIKKSIIEMYSEKGMQGGMTGLMDKFIEAITVDDFEKNIDPITNEEISSVPVSMVSNRLEIEEKSQDVGKILKAFSMMSLAYKHKSKIEDNVKLLQSTLHNSLEQQIDNAGEQKKDRFGNDVNTKGLKNLKEQVDYSVNSRLYGKTHKIQGKGKKKFYTSVEKNKKQEIEKRLLELDFQDEDGDSVAEKLKLNMDLEKLGKVTSVSSWGDQVLKYIQLKGIGWNFPSATTNMIIAYISNLTESAGGRYFNTKQFNRASGIMLNSVTSDISRNDNSKKIFNIIKKYNLNNGITEELYSNSNLSSSKASKGLAKASPFELTKRAEYFNIGSTTIATMLNTEVANGINLWDAYDIDGNLKTELFDESVLADWEFNPNNPNKYDAFKFRITQVNKLIHGNYDPDSKVKIKEGLLGRATMQFRSWVAEGVANRFEEEKFDNLLGMNRKGRYRTIATVFSEQGGFAGLIRESINILKGKSTLSEVDIYNMRKNLTEMAIYTSLLSLAAVMQGLDDDDENDYAANFLLNQISRVQTDITFYISPLSTEKLAKNILPVFSLIVDVDQLRVATAKFLQGNDRIRTGVNAGDSRITREFLQLFPLVSVPYKIKSAIQKVQN